MHLNQVDGGIFSISTVSTLLLKAAYLVMHACVLLLTSKCCTTNWTETQSDPKQQIGLKPTYYKSKTNLPDDFP